MHAKAGVTCVVIVYAVHGVLIEGAPCCPPATPHGSTTTALPGVRQGECLLIKIIGRTVHTASVLSVDRACLCCGWEGWTVKIEGSGPIGELSPQTVI